jgi:uncharacterized damage-inducible protein DinB
MVFARVALVTRIAREAAMFPMLRDMFGHQAWADAAHWRAIEAHPPARDDEILRRRLHHIHQVQEMFVWTVGARSTPFGVTTAGDFPTLDGLKEYARRVHADAAQLLEGLSDAELAEPVTITWFKDRPLAITRAEALLQSLMHSQWHRGQNATRLRELGVTPPTLDLIVWYWLGKPEPTWV